jgi:site-specific DNA recombinase
VHKTWPVVAHPATTLHRIAYQWLTGNDARRMMIRMKRTTTKQGATAAVIAYVRVSTEEQANEGVSLDAQEARIRAYCAMRGLELAEVVIDAGVSGYKALADRDGGRRVLEMVRTRKVGAVVALKLDRLFRNCADCLDVTAGWDRHGVALHLVDLGGQAVDTSSAMGRFFLTVMAGAAELERNQIAERTSTALQHKASRGERVGAVPFGFTLDTDGVHVVPVESEQTVIALARELRSAGLSLRAVAAELARRGHASRTGKAFQPHAVDNMVAA